MTQLVRDGIVASLVESPRLRTGVLERPSTARAVGDGVGDGSGTGDGDAPTVVFVHGNVSSALFWQPTMRDLPDHVRALALDLRGFGSSDTLPVDATRGLRDFADDVASTLETLGVTRAHLVGWSMGAGVVLQLLLDHPDVVASVTLVSPVSPYGFGGTSGADGRRLTDDDAGTGAGGANPDFVSRLAAGDDSADEQTSPRTVYQTAYVKPPFASDLDDVWVASMLTTATGDGNYPGTSVPSPNWPGFAPGELGVLNTMAPRYFNVSGIVDLATKPPILWIHGADDAIVSDASFFDINFLGQLGVIPGWPGAEVAPPQPMITQTRAVLDAYREAGGEATEITFDECGHSPHLEHPERFAEALAGHVNAAA
jgi:pimeloyl-ACP methyl ester carboxylesterase